LTNKKQDNINICTEPAKESRDNSKWMNLINTSSSQICPHLFTDEEDNNTIKIHTPTSNKPIVLNETINKNTNTHLSKVNPSEDKQKLVDKHIDDITDNNSLVQSLLNGNVTYSKTKHKKFNLHGKTKEKVTFTVLMFI
jgi:hypothetical protein